MLRFIRQILGLSKKQPSEPPSKEFPESISPVPSGALIQKASIDSSIVEVGGNKKSTDAYFRGLERLQEAVSKRDYINAARLARENLREIPTFIRSSKQSFGEFDISSVPALEIGGTMLALVGDDEGLAEMRRLVASNQDLEPWADKIQKHDKDRKLFVAILDTVQQNPGCLQSGMKSLIGVDDGRRLATLIGWLEKSGKIKREKRDKTYAIWLSESAQAPVPPPKRNVHSHRTDKNTLRLNEINITRIPYIPLPRAPLRWEEEQLRSVAAEIPKPINYFDIHDANGWEIESVDKIPQDEKPDTAFRKYQPFDLGLFMVDDLGNAEGFGQIPAAVLCYSRSGKLLTKKPLLHDIYRIDVNPMGQGLIAMSKDCVVHAYNDALKLILETTLRSTPELQKIQKRFDIRDDQMKNHVRCVALSSDNSRYLFTVVDEAWCVGIDGCALWGVKLPVKDGWTRISEPSKNFGMSGDIQQALLLMEMSYPFTPDDIKNRYRQLAKEWHPDLNQGSSTATEQMKALNSAVQLLTGISESSLPAFTGVQYAREMQSSNIEVGGVKLTMTASVVVSEIQAVDWIYAASFAGCSNTVFLAGYSGRVIAVNELGEPVRSYDIGSVPHRIVDTGNYLYILTDTRLYVLRDETLYTIIDTYDGGDLIVTQTGFGLLEKKRFRWFSEDGRYLGSILSKDPIRRVYAVPGGIMVETRTRRGFVRGVPEWWNEFDKLLVI